MRAPSASRVRELHDELGVRIPVYVLFTKADLIAGFVEFFDNFGREEREQVWGMTFPLDDGKSEGGAVADFAREFDQLLDRLNDRMLERVHQESDLAAPPPDLWLPAADGVAARHRGRIPDRDIPTEPAGSATVAARDLSYQRHPGRHADRSAARRHGGPVRSARQAITAFSGAGRSYFLTRLVHEVCSGRPGWSAATRSWNGDSAGPDRGLHHLRRGAAVADRGAGP